MNIQSISKNEDWRKLFNAFGGQKVLVIGDVMMDTYLWGQVDRISPEAPVPVVALQKRENRPGGAANVALNLQSMGAVPYLCSVIGKDDSGDKFVSLLDQQGMPGEGIVKSEDQVTTVKYRVMGNKVQMLRVDHEDTNNINRIQSEKLLNSVSNLIEKNKINCIIFEDYDKGVITPWLIAEVVKISKKHDIPVAVDPKKKNFLNYKGVTLFKPNLKELREGLKLDALATNPVALSRAVEKLHHKLKVPFVLATLSDKGVYHSSMDESGKIAAGTVNAHLRKIADVSGAGDTVISIISLCLGAGLPVEKTAQLANLAGGIVCEYAGVVPITKELLFKEALRLL